jgi:phospho-N-acetylmuramoyl-pentapeptide-transferase
MMYFLYHWRNQFSPLNVFFYITFRSIAAAVTSFLLSLMFGNWVIRRLIGLKVGQPIRTKEQVRELAELHGGKAGTPTMGGVLLLGSVVVSTLLWARLTNRSIWLALFTIVYLGLLGFVDDYLKVTKKKSILRSRCRRGRCMCRSTKSRLFSTLAGRRSFSSRSSWWGHRTR